MAEKALHRKNQDLVFFVICGRAPRRQRRGAIASQLATVAPPPVRYRTEALYARWVCAKWVTGGRNVLWATDEADAAASLQCRPAVKQHYRH